MAVQKKQQPRRSRRRAALADTTTPRASRMLARQRESRKRGTMMLAGSAGGAALAGMQGQLSRYAAERNAEQVAAGEEKPASPTTLPRMVAVGSGLMMVGACIMDMPAVAIAASAPVFAQIGIESRDTDISSMWGKEEDK